MAIKRLLPGLVIILAVLLNYPLPGVGVTAISQTSASVPGDVDLGVSFDEQQGGGGLVGETVRILNGNVIVSRADIFFASAHRMGLGFSAFYNSQSALVQSLGVGWSHTYRIIDLYCLMRLMGFTDLRHFQATHNKWVESFLQVDETKRQSYWTDSIAVGSQSFIKEVKNRLGLKAKARSVVSGKDHYHLRENVLSFGNPSLPVFESATGSYAETTNTFLWGDKP